MNDMYKLACPLILILPAVIHAQQPWFRSSPPDYLWQNVGIPERKQPGLYIYPNSSKANVIIQSLTRVTLSCLPVMARNCSVE